MKTIQILRPQTISIYEVEEMDLQLLSHKDLLDVSLQLLNALTNTNTRPKAVSMTTEHPQQQNHHKPTYGMKSVKATSKYHYIDCVSGRFRARPAGKHVGTFVGETEAALAADKYLDETKDLKRPRNVIEFPELLLCRGIAK